MVLATAEPLGEEVEEKADVCDDAERFEGAAVAGGMDLALMCDLRVGASDARFGQPQVKMGVPAAFELLKTVVSEPVARELCLTGRIIDGSEASHVGLVDRLVAPGDAIESALELDGEIASVAGAAAMKAAFVATQPVLFTNEAPGS